MSQLAHQTFLHSTLHFSASPLYKTTKFEKAQHTLPSTKEKVMLEESKRFPVSEGRTDRSWKMKQKR